jgi:hypothetical protein
MSVLWAYRNILRRPYSCVKCGGKHNSTLYKENSNTSAKLALGGRNHTVNYKCCDIHNNLQKTRSRRTIQPQRNYTQLHNSNINSNNNNHFPPLNQNQPPVPIPANQQTPYFRILTQNLQSSNLSEQLSTFLIDFKGRFNQLINQNSIETNMLSTLISKIAQ